MIALDDIQDDPHVRAVGLFETAEHPRSGAYRVIRSLIRFGATPFRVRRHAPMLGEHSVEILVEAGLSDGEIVDVLGEEA